MILLFWNAVSLLSVTAGLCGLWLWSRRLRIDQPGCPRCIHPVQGLAEPRCPECGGDLQAGVVGAGGIRPRTGLWFAGMVLVLGVFGSVATLGLLGGSWDSLLRMAGMMPYEFSHRLAVEVGVDRSNRLLVEGAADYVKSELADATGEVVVTLRSDDRELAVWKGSGSVQGEPGGGVVIDGMAVVDALRSQLPPDSDSPFAPILQDQDDAAILARAMVSYAAPGVDGVSGYVLDRRGRPMFDGGISATGRNRNGMIMPSAIWYAPFYVIPGVIGLAYLWLGVRVLLATRHRQAFEPHTDMA